jgi:hypothetical protein
MVEKIAVCRLCDAEINMSELMNHNFFCLMVAKCENTCRSVSRTLLAMKKKIEISLTKGQIDAEAVSTLTGIFCTCLNVSSHMLIFFSY